jgi:thioredoxin reductase (NADPH)
MNTPPLIETDALIIGAGPVGLFQVFQLGLLELQAHIVDALPYPGGQCVALYGDKPIYDIPGLPVCTGHELTERLLQQIKPFKPGLHLGQHITHLQSLPDGRFELQSSTHQVFHARTVFIAAGVGAFLARSLNLPGVEAFRGTQLFEGGLGPRERSRLPELGNQWVVLGGDDAAIQHALEGAAAGKQVTLIHRRDHFNAPPAVLEALDEARSGGRITFLAGQPIGIDTHQERISHLNVADPAGLTHNVPLDTLIACLGLSPKLGPVAEWGLSLERKQLNVNPASFQTSQPGIYAVGDINTYPGKKKLILCGFHEATLAAHHAARFLWPDEPEGPLLYTTSSPRLHRLLGLGN